MILGAAMAVVSSVVVAAMPIKNTNWSYGGAGGLVFYDDMIENDGQTIVGRLFLARQIAQKNALNLGIEFGVQTGNDGRLSMNAAQNFDLGNVAVQTFIKPMADILLTAEKPLSQFSGDMRVFTKAGIAYRQMHFDRDTINSLRKINPELQLGVSKNISADVMLNIAYQGIYSGNIDLSTNNPTNVQGAGTGNVKNIPTQHGILFSLSTKL